MTKPVLSLVLLSALTFSGDYTNSIGMKFKEIPAGSFTLAATIPANSNFFIHNS